MPTVRNVATRTLATAGLVFEPGQSIDVDGRRAAFILTNPNFTDVTEAPAPDPKPVRGGTKENTQ